MHYRRDFLNFVEIEKILNRLATDLGLYSGENFRQELNSENNIEDVCGEMQLEFLSDNIRANQKNLHNTIKNLDQDDVMRFLITRENYYTHNSDVHQVNATRVGMKLSEKISKQNQNDKEKDISK